MFYPVQKLHFSSIFSSAKFFQVHSSTSSTLWLPWMIAPPSVTRMIFLTHHNHSHQHHHSHHPPSPESSPSSQPSPTITKVITITRVITRHHQSHHHHHHSHHHHYSHHPPSPKSSPSPQSRFLEIHNFGTDYKKDFTRFQWFWKYFERHFYEIVMILMRIILMILMKFSEILMRLKRFHQAIATRFRKWLLPWQFFNQIVGKNLLQL